MKKIFFLDPVRMHSRDLNARWPEVEFRLLKNIRLCLVAADVKWGGYSVKNLVEEIRFRKYGEDRQRTNGKLDANVRSNWPAVNVAGRKALVAAQIKTIRGLVWTKYALLRIPPLIIFYGYYETVRRFVLVFAYSRVITLALLGDKTERTRIKRRWCKLRSAAASKEPN